MAKVAADNNSDRLVSLDAYRGFTMLMMVSAGMGMGGLLTHPQWGWLADQFTHRTWVGCTFWDLIQPSFMFIVGAAMPFSYANRQAKGQSFGRQLLHAILRAGLLIAIGVFLDSYADGRIYFQLIRVLQQIAIGYLIAFLLLPLGWAAQAVAVVLLLLGHTVAYVLYGQAFGYDPWLQPQSVGTLQNVGTYLDTVLHLRLSNGHYVTFNAISAAATILLGVLAGNLLRSGLPAGRKLAFLLLAGVAGLVIGWGLSGGDGWLPWQFEPLVPMIKRLWTSSFAIYAAGWTFLMLGLFYFLIDVLGFRWWSFPFVVVGMNSIAVYIVSALFTENVRRAVRLFVFLPSWLLPFEQVFIAIGMVAVFWLFCLWLYWHKIFIRL
jgi:heparan-alpha-glucosaminide N-acetyltransferase